MINNHLHKIRVLLVLFILALIFSGLTAIPIETELAMILNLMGIDLESPANNIVTAWLVKVYLALVVTNDHYPFLAYGYDWLAFGHLTSALLFIPVYLDPVKYKLNLDLGIIACFAIIPFALIAGEFRDIPIYWRIIHCCFGIFGGLLLLVIRRKIINYAQLAD